ncbi:putative actin-like protein [Trypanosoma rangeli]|uniref:Putative actin-like protein n=1 Tax=Trypanosoma rangeli TaxID=5698 RepID=A0A422P4P5_TRYRA|nr:putative actin-like protein [Trypanosoma rangeli]RNF12678.1 putative actin-like protein [Trypanosoma rangeli]|eukprot:RNF12678.1 putative actin-like protein [Trypanosoma rangeli]
MTGLLFSRSFTVVAALLFRPDVSLVLVRTRIEGGREGVRASLEVGRIRVGKMLTAGTACYRDVLDRLSQRLALILQEAEAYNQQHHRHGDSEKEEVLHVAGEDVLASLQPNPLLSWPPLRMQHRVDALRAQLSERKELQEMVRNVDTSMRELRQEFFIDVEGAAASHLRSDGCDVYAKFGHRAFTDGLKHGGCNSGGVAAQEAAVRRIVWLHQQLRRHKEDFRDLRKRASQAWLRLQPQFENIADVCGRIFHATASNDDGGGENIHENNGDGNGTTMGTKTDDPGELHALCRRNGERAWRLQSRLQRVLSLYQQVTARTNLELCRVELEVQAMERQSPHAEELMFPHYGGGVDEVGVTDQPPACSKADLV